jgi:hypothetical protein
MSVEQKARDFAVAGTKEEDSTADNNPTRRKLTINLKRLANECTGLWRELFTRACFQIGQCQK